MDFVVEETLKRIKKENSIKKMSSKELKQLHISFPIPKEQEVLWVDNVEDDKKCNIAITDSGLFIKPSRTFIKSYNKEVDKKEKIKTIYHYFKWEYFNVDDFKIKINEENKYEILFNKKKILELDNDKNFFSTYKDTYENIVKEAVVSAENIFADLEAVVPENFARVNSKHGHGEMAEEALTLLDKIQGNSAEVVGRTNEKNGADRLVNGVEIQTKYYNTGRGCVEACFDKITGEFRYQKANGEPMLVEVPKDKYAEAVNEFRKKILEKKVPGVSNPDDASKYIKKGKLTYNQALNLCKPGTIESLTYDALTGAVNCSCAFGITFLTTFIMSYSKTGDRKVAMQSALASGIQVFGLSFMAHVLTQQVARTTLTKQLIPLSNYMVQQMGPKAVQTMVNSIRAMAGKSAISGAAATKQLSKILRSNAVTAVITLAVFSVPDTYNIFKKRLSKAQYTKNMLSLVGTMATAGAGTLATSMIVGAKAGGTAGTMAGPVGTAIGIGGGLIGGFVGGVAIKAVGDYVREDDTVLLSRLFNAIVMNLIYEYMLNEPEIDVLMEKLNIIDSKEFKELFIEVLNAEKQEKVIEDYVRHYFEEIIRNRPRIEEPKPEDIIQFFSEIDNEDKIGE